MRETFTSLQTQAQNYSLQDTSAATLTFLKSEINRAQRFMFAELQDFQIHRVQTATQVTNQQYYHLPPDCIRIETVTVTINGVIYSLKPVDSQKKWDEINAVTFSGTAIPTLYLERKRDFGLWPIPQDSTSTITLVYEGMPIDMTQADYTTGTVTVTNGSTTVTGSGTTFAKWMEGTWFMASRTAGDGVWYKVSTFTSATVIVLETAYQGVTQTGCSYTIGESPDLPSEGHELIAYRAASMYFIHFRKDQIQAAKLDNLFWTGSSEDASRDPKWVRAGFLGLKSRYAKRSENRIIRRGQRGEIDPFAEQIWSTSITP